MKGVGTLNQAETLDATKRPHATIEFLLRRMQHKGDLPAFSQHIIEINKKLSSLHSLNFTSAGELSNVILKDISITNKLLRVVNSAFYSNMSGKITTISRAVFLLGFDKVRMAAASLMIFEHLQNKSQSRDLKDAALSSFISAVIAREAAVNIMYSSTEEVFICALLHNIGKNLVICYFPDEYDLIKNLISLQNIDEQQASKQVLGVSFSELGIGITKSWNFPDKIIDSMDIIKEPETKTSETEIDVLKSLANYGNDLCNISMEPDAAKRQDALQNLSNKYQISINLPLNRMTNLFEEAATQVDRYLDIFKIDITQSPLMSRLMACREDNIAKQKAALRTIQSPDSESITLSGNHGSAPTVKESSLEIIKNCINEINELLQSDCSLSDAIYMILETMYRGFEFHRVLFCMLDQSRSKMSARFGFGEGIDEIMKEFEFRITNSSDFFNRAFNRRQDFLIDDSQMPGIRENLPHWYSKIISSSSFLIFPLIIKEKCIGLFYADKKTQGILTGEQRDYMNILRSKAIWAILNKH